jgi:TolB-like protein/Flp pilus assembly protein TadD
MKRCPTCNRLETDEALKFCRVDGTTLVTDSSSINSEAGTAQLGSPLISSEIATGILPHATGPNINCATGPTTILPTPQLGTTSELSKPKRRKAVIIITVIVTAIVAATSAVLVDSYHSTKGRAATIQSIAVMPFVNESRNSDVEYLSDGMTETLIGSLSQLPNLNVKARSTVFRYKGKSTDAKTIGKELNVQAVLNGHVMQRGDQLTLSLELVNAETENVIWSGRYDRKQADLVNLQTDIARDVSSKLKSKLSGAEVAKVEKNYTTNPEAYQLYLKGKFYWNKRTGESLKQAAEFYQQAIEKDPNYALAYSGLADAYGLFSIYSVALPQESMPKAKAAALRAIELDDSLAEAHSALGVYLSMYSWNQPAAEKEFRRAIELNPNYATAHQQLANLCLMAMGRFDEAIAEGRRAEDLDPLSLVISMDVGANLTRARHFDDAIAQLNRTITLDPNFYAARYALGTAYHAKGQYAEATSEFRKALSLSDDPWVKALLARTLAKSGQFSEARKLLGELETEAAKRFVTSACFAIVYGALGDKDKAFTWLEKEVPARASRPPLFAVNPVYDDLRDDPRFQDLVRRISLAKLD